MKILVVGSSGYIGRHVVKNLASQGGEVVAFDLVPAPAAWQVSGVPFIQGNMTNLEEVMSAVLEGDPSDVKPVHRFAFHCPT